MNGYWIIVIGLVLVGIGGFLGFYGSQVNSRADNAKAAGDFNSQINKVLSAIESAKASTAATQGTTAAPADDAEARRKLEKIERDFSRWAVDFIKQRDLKASELERVKLEERNKELEVSKNYRAILQYPIDVLRRAVNAYNATAGTAFEVRLPDLPLNLYDVRDVPWVIGEIKFRDGVEWRIRLWAERPVSLSSLPRLQIIVENAGSGNPGPDTVEICLMPPDYTVATHGGGIVTATNLNSREPLNSYQERLRTTLQDLLEVQIASLPRK